jgi:hypothetical protein
MGHNDKSEWQVGSRLKSVCARNVVSEWQAMPVCCGIVAVGAAKYQEKRQVHVDDEKTRLLQNINQQGTNMLAKRW